MDENEDLLDDDRAPDEDEDEALGGGGLLMIALNFGDAEFLSDDVALKMLAGIGRRLGSKDPEAFARQTLQKQRATGALELFFAPGYRVVRQDGALTLEVEPFNVSASSKPPDPPAPSIEWP